MALMSKKDCDKTVKSLEAWGWDAVAGKVMSYDENLGFTVGVLVRVGDERLRWIEPVQTEENQESAAHALTNFFAQAHMVTKKPELSKQPADFSFTSVGPGLVHLAPGQGESVSKFMQKLSEISTVQMGLIDAPKRAAAVAPAAPAAPAVTVAAAAPVVAAVPKEIRAEEPAPLARVVSRPTWDQGLLFGMDEPEPAQRSTPRMRM